MESVRLMPYSIAVIDPQTEALQETALRTGFENRLILKRIYDGLINPSDRINQMYSIMSQLNRLLLSSEYVSPTLWQDLKTQAKEYNIPTDGIEKLLRDLKKARKTHAMFETLAKENVFCNGLDRKLRQRTYGA